MDDFAHKEIVNTFFGRKKRKKSKRPALLLLSGLLLVLILVFIVMAQKYEQKKEYLPVFNILRGGKLNYSLVERVYYEGGAKEKSALLAFSAKLVDFGDSGHAAFVVVFKEPVDFSGKVLLVSAKTEDGRKNIRVALMDSAERIYEIPAIRLESDWCSSYIALTKNNGFGLREVKELRFVLEINKTEGTQGSTIYIKDIILEK
jgi:hypothetical protein